MSFHCNLFFTAFRIISLSRCSCVAGESAHCKHGAALYTYINSERTEGQTDSSQTWITPSKKLQEQFPKGESLMKIFGRTSSPTRNIIKQSDNPSLCEDLVRDLEKFGLTGASIFKTLTVLKNVNPEPVPSPISTEDIPLPIKKIFFQQPLTHKIKPPQKMEEKCATFYNRYVKCSSDSRLEIFQSSIGQFSNLNWFQSRKYRVSASKARKIAFARKDETLLRSFYDSAVDCFNLRYGREMESIARAKFTELNAITVYESGLVVSQEFPWLGASPDGIIIQPNGEIVLLEIKCPVSGQFDVMSEPSYIINGDFKKSHEYYAQIQIQMLVCNAQNCVHFVCGQKNSFTYSVKRDEHFI